MTDEFEDPRKTQLRQRTEEAADAAGYNVDPTRPKFPLPASTGLKGAIHADVVAIGADGTTCLIFVRVDGNKALPGWLANYVRASIEIADTSVYVVVEAVGEQLRATCDIAGAGLLVLGDDNSLGTILEYNPPDPSAVTKAFERRRRQIRRRLDAKLRLNLRHLEQSFAESYAVTEAMEKKARDEYLSAIENAMVAWRTWGEEMSERLDAASIEGGADALDAIEAEISLFDGAQAKAA